MNPDLLRGAALRALLVVCAALFGTAAAQCSPGPTTSQVTIPDYLAVYYQQFRSMPEADEVLFYGGVCVTAVGAEWTVFADAVTVTGLNTELGLRAESPRLFWGELRLTAAHMAATEEVLVLQEATVAGPDYSGEAQSIELDVMTGQMQLIDVVLNSVAFAVTGSSAALVGTQLSVEEPELTTCIGMDAPPYAIEGSSATVDLSTRSAVLRQGTLRVGALRVPLDESISVTEESLERFTLPFRFQNVSDRGDPTLPGTGVGARIVDLPLGDGASLDVGVTGLDPEHPTGMVLLVHAAEETDGTEVVATFGLEGSSPLMAVDVTRHMTPWLELELGARTGAEPAQPAHHEARAALEANVPVPAIGGSVGAEVFTASTAVSPAGDPTMTSLFGTRVGVSGSVTTSTGATPFGTFTVLASAQTTWYPRQQTSQWGVRLNPRWTLEASPVTASLSYDTWLTNAASPFADVDRLSPLSRTRAAVRVGGRLVAWEDGGELMGFIGASGVHDGVPVRGEPAGYVSAIAEAGVQYLEGTWTVDASVSSQLAGLLSPESQRDAYVTYVLQGQRAGWPAVVQGTEGPIVPHGAFELRAEALQGLADQVGLRRLELSAAVPFAFPSLELRPFIGFDIAPTILSGGLPELSVHGLDLTFITCCGSLTVGYTNERGAWSASFSIDLERRPPQ